MIIFPGEFARTARPINFIWNCIITVASPCFLLSRIRVGVMPVCGGESDRRTIKLLAKKTSQTSSLTPAAVEVAEGCSGKYKLNIKHQAVDIAIIRRLLLSGGIKLFYFDSTCKGNIRDSFLLIPDPIWEAAQSTRRCKAWVLIICPFSPPVECPQSIQSTHCKL